MLAARSRTLLVVALVALGMLLASAPASAATPSCAKQTKALLAAKKRLKRATTASGKVKAKRQVTKARRSLATCRKRRKPAPKKPPTTPTAPTAPSVPVAPVPVAPAPVAPAPAPAPPSPAPAPGPSLDTLTLAPTAPSSKDLLVFRWSPPGGGPLATQQPVLDFRTPSGDPRTCIKERTEVVPDGSRGFERRFSPFGYPPLDPSKPTLPALSDWCPGAWTATVAYRDTATGATSGPVSSRAFTISPYVP